MKMAKIVILSLAFFAFSGLTQADTQVVSQADYATNNNSYDRNPSIVFDGFDYWLFYAKGDNLSTSGIRGVTYNPDEDNYVIYYKTASTLAGLASASETKLELSESARPTNFTQRVVSAAAFGANLYAFVSSGQDGINRGLYYYVYDGVSWSGPVELIADATARGGHVNVASDADRIYIVWESSDGSSDCYTWDGASLSSKIDISNGNQPKITLLSGARAVGVLYVVNIEDVTGDIELFQSATDASPAFGAHSTPISGGGFYDPCVFNDGTNLYVISAPYVATDRQYIIQTKSVGTSASWSATKTISYGGYGSIEWWDYWPCGFYDGTNAWVFFTTETNNGPSYSDGEIAFAKIDWDLAYNHYFFIQNGIDQAISGDEVSVLAGIYNEHDITISKSLTLTGDPGDAYPGPGANAPVIDGGSAPGDAFLIANGVTNVTIEGFEMRNFTSPDLNGIGNGISAWEASTSNITVRDNYFHHLGYNGVLVGNDGAAGDHTNWLIENNVIEEFGYIGFELTNTSNSSIEDNVIHLMTPYIGAIFSSARRSETGLTIKNNLIDGSPSAVYPVIYIYAYDIDIPNPNLNSVLIEGNTITTVGTPSQIYIRDINTGTVTGVTVVNNNLLSLKNLTSQTLDASSNWWGDLDPSDNHSGDADYTPWLAVGTDIEAGTPGFQGDFTSLYVDDDSPQVGTTGRIQEGINLVSGSTVYVLAGTYNEHDITINKSLTLTGDPGDALPGPGVNAPIVDGQDLWSDAFLLANGVSNVTIQGFEIRNYAGTGNGAGNAVQAWVPSTSNITVNDNYMHHLSWNGVLVGDDLPAAADHTYWTIARNILTDFGPTAFAVAGYGLELTNTSYGVIEDNIIDAGSRFPGIGILVQMRRPSGQDILIQRNNIRGQYDFAGINVQASTQDVPVSNLDNVRILNNDVEISGASIPAVQIRNKLNGTVTGVIIGDNKLINPVGYGLKNLTSLTLDASSNWWGTLLCSEVASSVFGDVDYDPWCNENFSFCGFSCSLAEAWVDDDWAGFSVGDPVGGHIFGFDAFAVIQEAIDAVNGSTIHVAAGTYREQLYIDKSLDLLGSGSGDCIIEAPDPGNRSTYSITQWNSSVKTIDAVIGVHTAGTVNIDGFKIDGRDTGPGNFYGVHFFDADGSVTNCVIDNITYSAVPGTSSIVSMLATHSLGESFTIDISGITIPKFQKGGIVLMGPGCSFTVNDNNVTGQASSSLAGNCIQLSYGAHGSTSGNYVEGTAYTGDDWASTGILLFESGSISMNGDEVYNCQSGINYSDWGWIYNNPIPVNLDLSNVNLHGNEWTLGVQMSRDNSDINLTVTNSSILDNGGDGVDLWGTGASSYYSGWSNGNLTATIIGCTISNSIYDGIWTADLSGNTNNTAVIDVHECYFTGNSSSAINNTITQTVSATRCYWDDATGPTVGTRSRATRQTSAMISPFDANLSDKGITYSTSYNDSRGSGETILGPVNYSPFWTANYLGDPHTSPWTWGVDNSGTIADGIAAASGDDNIIVYPGTYAEGPQVVVDKNLSIAGVDRSTVTITPTANTGNSGDTRGWFLVLSGVNFDMSEVTIDGNGFNIYQAFRSYGDLSFTAMDLMNIRYSKYIGIACAIMDASLTADDCNLSNIERVGFLMFGPGSNANLIENCTYIGKGDGDWLDYAFEFGNGASGTVDYCEVYNNTGVAASDGSTSAGMLATTYYGLGTTATITNCNFHDNTQGIAVGYDGSDATTVIAHNNIIRDNPSAGIASTSTIGVDAESNYWGTISCPDITTMVSGNVDFEPWCNSDFTYCNFTCAISEVWVDDDWAGTPEGSFIGGHIFGYDAFDIIPNGVDAVSDGGIVHVFNGNYAEPINIEGRTNISIIGENRLGTIFKPSSTIGWQVASYGNGRQTAIRVVGSGDITLSNMTMDFDLIKGDNIFGLLYWNSTGEISSNTLQNMNTAGYYEFISYLRAPDFTDVARAQIDILNNTFLKTGRVGIVIHDYVNTLIEGNQFDKVDDDFGYAIELGSMATGIIRGNSFSNYDTWAATDQSTVSAIYVENSFTNTIVNPIIKAVTIEGNDISYCQYGIIIGNEFPGYAGNVDIAATINNNSIHNNSTAGSLSCGGIIITDEGKNLGSSVAATLTNNTINNNGDKGLSIYTDGNGDVTLTMTDNIIADHYTGVSVKDYATTSSSSYNLTVHHNIFDNNLNAEDDAAGGYWDDLTTETGNCWSDYELNSGYPIRYDISGNAGTRDRRPNRDCGALCACEPGEVNNIPPVNILDVVYLINFKYKAGPASVPYPVCNADPNCDCLVDILDIVYLINSLYKDGPDPCGCSDWFFSCKLPFRSGALPQSSTETITSNSVSKTNSSAIY